MMKIKIYSISILVSISLLSKGFAQTQNTTYTIQEILNDSKNLDINTYALYPDNTIKNELTVVLYPNPVDDILNVKISGAKGEKISYTLFDISGKLISVKDEKNSSFTINMVSVLSGAYILVIKDEASKKAYKIIKK
jgi:hypothetical protein